MDIKARIDALTEAEAKAALAWVINFFGAGNRICVNSTTDFDMVQADILDEALKEARK